jgi:hypothetical protein
MSALPLPPVPEKSTVRVLRETLDLSDTFERATRPAPDESGPVAVNARAFTHPQVPVASRAEVKRLEALLELLAG